MIIFNLYRASSNWYCRFIRVTDSMIWDNSNARLAADTVWTDSAISLSFNSSMGGHAVSLPSLPAGEYDVLFYNNASQVDTDEVQVGRRIRVAVINGQTRLAENPVNNVVIV